MRNAGLVLRGRSGVSLAEMVLVMALGGLITTAAVSMIGPTNSLATQATDASEIEEGSRSTINLIAGHLRRVPQGGVLVATRDSIVVAMPVGMGVFCSNDGNRIAAYLGLGGRPLNVASLDGYALQNPNATWTFTTMPGTTYFSGTVPGRSYCTAAGGGLAGNDADYVMWQTSTTIPVGTGFFAWDKQTYRFGVSVLDPRTRGFFYGATGAPLLEVAFELHPNSRFEYRLRGSSTWYPAVASGSVMNIDVVRVVAGGLYDTNGGLLSREIPLMNSE